MAAEGAFCLLDCLSGEIIWQWPAKMVDRSGRPYVEQFIHGKADGPIKMDVLKG